MPKPSRTAYREGLLLARARMGSIHQMTALRLSHDLSDFAHAISRGIERDLGGRAWSDRALKRSRFIVRQAAQELFEASNTTVGDSRAVAFRSVLDVWDRAGEAAAKSAGIDLAALGGVHAPRVNMLGAFENIGGAKHWRTLLRGHADDAAREANRIVRMAIAEGVGPDELAKRLRPYVIGAENVPQRLFSNVPTLSGDVTKIDLRRVPKAYRGSARKMRYNARRIAVTELEHARHEATIQHAFRDPLVAGMQWMLSPDRGSLLPPDECDVLADADMYGLGGGVYPVGRVPAKPHPFDRCELLQVPRDTTRADKPKPHPRLAKKPGDVRIPRGDQVSKAKRGRILDSFGAAIDNGRLAFNRALREEGSKALNVTTSKKAVERVRKSFTPAPPVPKSPPPAKAVEDVASAAASGDAPAKATAALERVRKSEPVKATPEVRSEVGSPVVDAQVEAAKDELRDVPENALDVMSKWAADPDKTFLDLSRRYPRMKPELRSVWKEVDGEINDARWVAFERALRGKYGDRFDHLRVKFERTRKGWMHSSNGPPGGAIKRAAQELRGGEITFHDARYLDHDVDEIARALAPVEEYLEKHGITLSEFIDFQRAQSSFSRALLDVLGRVDEDGFVTLYRGVDSTYVRQHGLQDAARGDVVTAATNSASSWSFSPKVAQGFARQGGVVFETRVHVSRVLDTAFSGEWDGGYMGEVEAIIGGRDVKAEVIEAAGETVF